MSSKSGFLADNMLGRSSSSRGSNGDDWQITSPGDVYDVPMNVLKKEKDEGFPGISAFSPTDKLRAAQQAAGRIAEEEADVDPDNVPIAESQYAVQSVSDASSVPQKTLLKEYKQGFPGISSDMHTESAKKTAEHRLGLEDYDDKKSEDKDSSDEKPDKTPSQSPTQTQITSTQAGIAGYLQNDYVQYGGMAVVAAATVYVLYQVARQ